MNHNEFTEYLRGQYRPDPGQDEDGGYLIPNTIIVDKAGKLPKIYRWVGRLFGSWRLYKKGVNDVDLWAGLMTILKEK